MDDLQFANIQAYIYIVQGAHGKEFKTGKQVFNSLSNYFSMAEKLHKKKLPFIINWIVKLNVNAKIYKPYI